MSSNKFSVLQEDDDVWEVVTKKKPRKKSIPASNPSPIEPKKSITKKPDQPSYSRGNVKQMLCKNILGGKKCSFKTCSYAHALSEQIINNDRKEFIRILNDTSMSLQNIDLNSNKSFLETALAYTRLCNNCKVNNCVGGYNCNFGAPVERLVICMVDFYTGTCDQSNTDCTKIHLTERNLIPYEQQMQVTKHTEAIESLLLKPENKTVHGTRKYNSGFQETKSNDSNSITPLIPGVQLTRDVIKKMSRCYVDPSERIDTLKSYYDINDSW